MLDNTRRIATPEGIELTLRLAGPVPRLLAWLADLLLRIAVLLAVVLLLAPSGNFAVGIYLLLWFFLEWLFPAWCEVYWGGATPGKKWFGLQVLHDDGSPVCWPAALTRNLLRFVDFFPLLYATGLVVMIASRDFKRLGDLVAGTVVVYAEPKARALSIAAAEPFPPAIPLSLAEQRAILDFAERAQGLTPERAAELAAMPAALTGALSGAAATERLMRIANHIIGRR